MEALYSTCLRLTYNIDCAWPRPYEEIAPKPPIACRESHRSHYTFYLGFDFSRPGIVVVLYEPTDSLSEGLFEWSEFEVANEVQQFFV